MYHKKRDGQRAGDYSSSMLSRFIAFVRIDYFDSESGSWTTYTSETYPDGVIPTGLILETPYGEIKTTFFDPPIFTNRFRMYGLPHSDGKLRLGEDCGFDLKIDFKVVWSHTTTSVILTPPLGSVTDRTSCF